jgi:hypothetical protein
MKLTIEQKSRFVAFFGFLVRMALYALAFFIVFKWAQGASEGAEVAGGWLRTTGEKQVVFAYAIGILLCKAALYTYYMVKNKNYRDSNVTQYRAEKRERTIYENAPRFERVVRGRLYRTHKVFRKLKRK